MELDSDVTAQLSAMVADDGLELLATEVVGNGPKTVLRIVIDGPDGVTLDQCSSVSRQASALLDVEDPIGHRYTLEVTSPGLDRKLYRRDDYLRYAGQPVKIRMRPTYRDLRVVAGELVGISDDTVSVRTEADETVELPFEEVFEARLAVDLDAILREGKNRP